MRCCAPRQLVGLGAWGQWLLPGGTWERRGGDMLYGERLGQPGRDSTWDSSVATTDRVLGCPMSPLFPVTVLTHVACEGLRTVTMASSSHPEAAVAQRCYFYQWGCLGQHRAWSGDTGGWGLWGSSGHTMAKGHRTACL